MGTRSRTPVSAPRDMPPGPPRGDAERRRDAPAPCRRYCAFAAGMLLITPVWWTSRQPDDKPNAPGRRRARNILQLRRADVSRGFGFTYDNDLFVEGIAPGGAADAYGLGEFLRRQITHVDGREVGDAKQLSLALRGRAVVTLRFAAVGARTPAPEPEPEPTGSGSGDAGVARAGRRAVKDEEEEPQQAEPSPRGDAAAAPARLKVGGKVRLRKMVKFASGKSVDAGAFGVISAVPGETPGSVAEVDFDGIVFDAEAKQLDVLVVDAQPAAGDDEEEDNMAEQTTADQGRTPSVLSVEIGDSPAVRLYRSPKWKHHQLPVWTTDHAGDEPLPPEKRRVLFCTGKGFWMLGREDGPKKNKGEVKSHGHHHGRMPHAMRKWDALQGAVGSREWTPDPSIKIRALEFVEAGAQLSADNMAKLDPETRLKMEQGEEPAEWAKLKATSSSAVPRIIHIKSSVAKTYLTLGEPWRSMPTWADSRGRRLFTNSKHGWMLSRTGDAEDGPARNRGEMRTRSPHRNMMPHLMKRWQSLLGEVIGKKQWEEDTVELEGRGDAPFRLPGASGTGRSVGAGSGDASGWTVIKVLDVVHSGAASLDCTFGSGHGDLFGLTKKRGDAAKKVSVIHVDNFQDLKTPPPGGAELLSVVVVRDPVSRIGALLNGSADGLVRRARAEPKGCGTLTLSNYHNSVKEQRYQCSRDQYVRTITNVESVMHKTLMMNNLQECKKKMVNVEIVLWHRFDEGMWLLARRLGFDPGTWVRCAPLHDAFSYQYDGSAVPIAKWAGGAGGIPMYAKQPELSRDIQDQRRLSSRLRSDNINDMLFLQWATREYDKRHSEELQDYHPGALPCPLVSDQVECWLSQQSRSPQSWSKAQLAGPGAMCARKCTRPQPEPA